MPTRRDFLTELGALAAAGLPAVGGARAAAVVEAEPTIFFANPDGATSLVRFHVTGVSAPAGRLRVFDRRNRLIGTAGVLRRGDRLYGELWLPLEGDTRIRSELEAPGVRGVFRTTHRVRPARRWTIHWVTVADPALLRNRLAALDPARLAVERAVLEAAGVMGNPLSAADAPDLLDTAGLLRVAAAAGDLERRYGIPASSVAVLDPAMPLPATIVAALVGSGVRYAVERRSEGPLLRWLEGADGSRLLAAAVPSNGDTRSLAFGGPAPEMTRLVEQWLATTPLLLAPGAAGSEGEGAAFVVDAEPAPNAGRIVAAVAEWNRRYAFPRIAIGAGEELADLFGESRTATVPVTHAVASTYDALPARGTLERIAERRADDRRRRALEALAPLTAAVTGAWPPLGGAAEALGVLAGEIETVRPGTLVFNPAPVVRTDAVSFPDGTTRIVTSLPPLGYAFVVELPGGPAGGAPEPPTLTASTAGGRIAIDERSGAIGSLVDADGGEWVRSGGDGLNAVPGAILERWSSERLPGAGTRFHLQRWSREWGEVHSTVTVYDTLPWVDIENTSEALGDRPMGYHFGVDLSEPEISWEVPAGFERGAAPRRFLPHGRWVCLQNGRGSAVLRALDAAFASVLRDGTVISHAGGSRSRYRFQIGPAPQTPATCARFGWGAEPLVAVPASGSPTGRLPRHGTPLEVDQPGLAIVDGRPSEEGTAVIVLVQDFLGTDRYVSLVAGLLTFREAWLTDYLGRPQGDPLEIVEGGVIVPVRPWGVAAVRLEGLALRGA